MSCGKSALFLSPISWMSFLVAEQRDRAVRADVATPCIACVAVRHTLRSMTACSVQHSMQGRLSWKMDNYSRLLAKRYRTKNSEGRAEYAQEENKFQSLSPRTPLQCTPKLDKIRQPQDAQANGREKSRFETRLSTQPHALTAYSPAPLPTRLPTTRHVIRTTSTPRQHNPATATRATSHTLLHPSDSLRP